MKGPTLNFSNPGAASLPRHVATPPIHSGCPENSHPSTDAVFKALPQSVLGSKVSSLYGSPYFNLPTNTWGEDYYYLSFTVEGT